MERIYTYSVIPLTGRQILGNLKKSLVVRRQNGEVIRQQRILDDADPFVITTNILAEYEPAPQGDENFFIKRAE